MNKLHKISKFMNETIFIKAISNLFKLNNLIFDTFKIRH